MKQTKDLRLPEASRGQPNETRTGLQSGQTNNTRTARQPTRETEKVHPLEFTAERGNTPQTKPFHRGEVEGITRDLGTLHR